MLLYGDSHLKHLTKALVDKYSEEYHITIVTGLSCFMGTNIKKFENAVLPNACENKHKFLDNLNNKFFDVVITSQFWELIDYGLVEEFKLNEAIKDRVINYHLEYEKLFILGNNVVNPNINKIKDYLFSRESNLDTFKHVKLFEEITNEMSFKNVKFIHPYHQIEKFGQFTINLKAIYSDDSHLSYSGSKWIVNLINETIN